MKNYQISLLMLCVASAFSAGAWAQNIIRSQAPIIKHAIQHNWTDTAPEHSVWINSGAPENCTNWSPVPDTVGLNLEFTQTATDCDQNQSRTRQERQVSQTTGEYRNLGDAVEEMRIIAASLSRQAVGTLEAWLATSPVYTDWVNNGDIYGCHRTAWGPDSSTVTVGQSFTQTNNNCKQNQVRTRQDREQEKTTLAYRNVGNPIEENQVAIASLNRSWVGTMETWIAAEPVYSDWSDSGTLYGCTIWSPDPGTVSIGQNFTQTANDCKLDQARTRQDREQETTTLDYRNAGAPVTETQVLSSRTSSRAATGTKPAPAKVCKHYYNLNDYNNYTMVYSYSAGSLYWYWEVKYDSNFNLVSGDYFSSTSNTVYRNGYTYTIGSYVSTDYVGTSYYICRQ